MKTLRNNKAPIILIILILLFMTALRANAATPVYPQEELSDKVSRFTIPVIANATDHSKTGASTAASTGASKDPGKGSSRKKPSDDPGTGATASPAPAPAADPGTGAQTGKPSVSATSGTTAKQPGTGSTKETACKCGKDCPCCCCHSTTSGTGSSASHTAGTMDGKSSTSATTGISAAERSGITGSSAASTGKTVSAGTGTGASTGASRTSVTKRTIEEQQTETKEPESNPPARTEKIPLGAWIALGFLLILSGLLFWFFLIRTGKLSDWWYFTRALWSKNDEEDDDEDDGDDEWLNDLDISDLKPLPEETDHLNTPADTTADQTDSDEPDPFERDFATIQHREEMKEQSAILEAQKEEEAENNMLAIDENLKKNMTPEEEAVIDTQNEEDGLEEAKRDAARRKQILQEQRRLQEKRNHRKGKHRGY